MFSLPVRHGGLGIRNPTTTADSLYSTSRSATQIISNAIKGLCVYSSADHYDQVLSTKLDYLQSQEVNYGLVYDTIFEQSVPMTQRSMTRNKQSLSAWLTTLPILKDDFNLSSVEFRDALCLRYRKPLLQLPPICDGCSAPFTTTHALDCRKGGLVIHRHHEIRDLFHDLSSLVWPCIAKEPVVRDGSMSDPPCESLIADFSARGVWQPQVTALFDVRVIDTDAPSYINKSPINVLKTAEREKKMKYGRACEDRHASFTPLCISIDGLQGTELNTFVKRMALSLAAKWDRPLSTILYWVRAKLSFSLIRAVNLCIRGSRHKWRGIGMEDGFGINPTFLN